MKDKLYEVAFANAKHKAYSKPGIWNDPDYVIIGNIGIGNGKVATAPGRPTNSTPTCRCGA